jgi:DNA-binding NtrC family response regulator
VAVTADDVRLLQAYDWPGNIRELGAVIDRAAILGDGATLEIAKSLGLSDATSSKPAQPPGASATIPPPRVPPRDSRSARGEGHAVPTLDEAMQSHIELVLTRTRGRIEGKRGAAALLDINPHTLRARMRKLGIDWSRFRESTWDQVDGHQ